MNRDFQNDFVVKRESALFIVVIHDYMQQREP